MAIRSVDPEFDPKDFARGAAQAIETVSHRLASRKYDELEGIVTPKTLSAHKNIFFEKDRCATQLNYGQPGRFLADIVVGN